MKIYSVSQTDILDLLSINSFWWKKVKIPIPKKSDYCPFSKNKKYIILPDHLPPPIIVVLTFFCRHFTLKSYQWLKGHNLHFTDWLLIWNCCEKVVFCQRNAQECWLPNGWRCAKMASKWIKGHQTARRKQISANVQSEEKLICCLFHTSLHYPVIYT